MLNTKNKHPRWTSSQVRTVLKLKAEKVPAQEIAERFGRSRGSVYQLWNRTKDGWTPDGPETMQTKINRGDRIAWLFEQGVTATEISRIFGISAASVMGALDQRGIDGEIRREIVGALPPIARIAHTGAMQ